MGQAVSAFFAATLVEVAKNAWATVVDGLTAFAQWVEKEVMSLVNSVINSIGDMLQSLKQFFINCWNSVEAFTQKIFGLEPNVKDYVWTKVYEVGKELQGVGIEHMRKRLKEKNYKDIDSLTNDQVEKVWEEYMSQHPLTAEQKKKMDATFGESTSAPSNMMSSTRAYSKFASEPTSDPILDEVNETTESLRRAGLERIREKLKELNYKDIDSLSDEEVLNLWQEYISQHPLTPEEKKEIEDVLSPSNMMSSTGLGATSPQHSEDFKLFKDHAITHLTLVLLSPEQLKIGLPKSVSLAPHEVQELNRILSI